VFEVAPDANKLQIRQAIKQMFDVDAVSVRTVRTKGKVKTRMTRQGMQVGKTNLKKKAYVTLKEGQTIDIVSGEGNEE
jgi:large subunit ribosomal protein L23